MSFYESPRTEDLSSSLISEDISDSALTDDSPRGKLKTGYYLEKKIGAGKFGSVYKGIDCASERSVAIKVVDLTKDKERITGFREIEIYKKLTGASSNIIEYYHSFIHQDEQRLYIIMEVGKIDLFSLLNRKVDPSKLPFLLNDNVKTKMTSQISRGVSFLQTKGLIHRDIKPENIIVCKTGLKICDFGLSIFYDELNPPDEFIGTLDYLAPEIIKCRGPDASPYCPSVDLWSLGIVIYEIFTGTTPFYNQDIKTTALNILTYNDCIIYPQGKVPPMPVCRLLKQLIRLSDKEREIDQNFFGLPSENSSLQSGSWSQDIFSSSE